MSKHDLYDKFLTDSLSETEEKELLNILEDDEKSQKFTEHIIETNMMVSAAENCESAETQTIRAKTEIRSIIMIAAAMIALGLFLFFKPIKGPFEIVSSNISNYKAGSFSSDEIFEISDGLVTLKHENGNTFQLKGPAKLKVNSENNMTLSKGSLITSLAAGVKDFTLILPNGKIKDLGTSFGTILKGAKAEVHVFSGKVEVYSKVNTQRLIEGESISFESSGEFKRVEFKKDIFNIKEADVIFMGDRKLHPGEQLELYLDAVGEALTGKVSLNYEKQKDLEYKVIAFSKSKKVFESKRYKADDQYEINIPAQGSQELTIEMKVLKGHATNGILNIKGLSLITEGYRPYEGETLIKSNSEWRYLFKDNPPQNWMSAGFDVSKWPKGITSIGYGDSDLRTKIGGNELKKTVSKIFFRHQFDLGNLETNSLKKVKVNLLADDGALIFINGREAMRYNLPQGPINLETKALKVTKGHGEMVYTNFSIPASFLLPGENTVSVILFQRKGQSSDMRFDLQMMVF